MADVILPRHSRLAPVLQFRSRSFQASSAYLVVLTTWKQKTSDEAARSARPIEFLAQAMPSDSARMAERAAAPACRRPDQETT